MNDQIINALCHNFKASDILIAEEDLPIGTALIVGYTIDGIRFRFSRIVDAAMPPDYFCKVLINETRITLMSIYSGEAK